MTRIGFVTTDWSAIKDPLGHNTLGGSGWYRIGLPQAYLARNGFDVPLGAAIAFDRGKQVFVMQDHDEQFIEDLDIVVMSRWMNEVGPEAVKRARASGQVVINDVDDWYDGLHPTNVAWRTLHPKASPDNNVNHYRKICANSDGLIVSTPFLREKMLRINEKVVICSNAIDYERWEAVQRPADGPPVIGWVGAVPWRSQDLEAIRGVLSDLLSDYPELRLFHGGHIEYPGVPSLADLVDVDRERVDEMPMLPIHHYPMFFSRFNIGVVPLSDVPFNHAKSWIKGLEMGAASIPFVASPLPAYQELELFGVGRTARKFPNWRKLLEPLVASVDHRQGRGGLYRENAAGYFDMAERWVDWRDAIVQISGYTLAAGSSAPREYAQPVPLQATGDTRS